MKGFATILMLTSVIFFGCAGITPITDPVVDVFCFEKDGKAKEIFERVPTIGEAIVGAVGVCVPEEETIVEEEVPSTE